MSEGKGDDGFGVFLLLGGVAFVVALSWVLFLHHRHRSSPDTARLRGSADAASFRVNGGSRAFTATAVAVVLEPPWLRFVPVADQVVYREDVRCVYRQLVLVQVDEGPDRWDEQFVFFGLRGERMLVVSVDRGSPVFETLRARGWPMVDVAFELFDPRAPWRLPEPPA